MTTDVLKSGLNLVQYLLVSYGDQSHMKESQLGTQLKEKTGGSEGGKPLWQVACRPSLTQPKQPKTLLGYSTHAPWACSSLQHSWSYEQEAKNMQ